MRWTRVLKRKDDKEEKMKKQILHFLAFSLIFFLFVLILNDDIASSTKQDEDLIKQKMNQLGFQVGKITKQGGNYIIVVNSYTAKTQALRKGGRFKSFTLTAKVAKGQVSLNKDDLNKAGFAVSERALPGGIKIEKVKAVRAAPSVPMQKKTAVSAKQILQDAHKPKPDLIVEEIDFGPKNPTLGTRLTLVAWFKNQGEEYAVFPPNSVMKQLDMPHLRFGPTKYRSRPDRPEGYAPGEKWRFNTLIDHWSYKNAGTYYITITIDPDNIVIESNETNNTARLPVTYRNVGLPDLTINNIEVIPPSKRYGDYTIRVNVQNRGTEKVNFRSSSYKFLVSDLGTKNADPPGADPPGINISPNEIKSFEFKKYLEPDTYDWNFEVNPKVEYLNDNRIPESNENNNTASYRVTIHEDGQATVKRLLTLMKVKPVQKKDIKKIKRK